MSKTARGALLLMMGLILVAAAAMVHLMQDWQDQLAGQNASILLNKLERDLEEDVIVLPPVLLPPEKVEEPPAEITQEPEPPVETVPPMPEVEYSGYKMVGRLSIPSRKIELPVLSTWDYDSLKVAPCRYSGTAAGGDLILLGHNYKTHLGPIGRAKVGAEVEFTGADGAVYRYVVDAVDTIRGTDVDKLASEHELILFTCTLDRVHRTVVRCSRVYETEETVNE